MSDQDEPAGRNEAEISPGPILSALSSGTHSDRNKSFSKFYMISVGYFFLDLHYSCFPRLRRRSAQYSSQIPDQDLR